MAELSLWENPPNVHHPAQLETQELCLGVTGCGCMIITPRGRFGLLLPLHCWGQGVFYGTGCRHTHHLNHFWGGSGGQMWSKKFHHPHQGGLGRNTDISRLRGALWAEATTRWGRACDGGGGGARGSPSRGGGVCSGTAQSHPNRMFVWTIFKRQAIIKINS